MLLDDFMKGREWSEIRTILLSKIDSTCFLVNKSGIFLYRTLQNRKHCQIIKGIRQGRDLCEEELSSSFQKVKRERVSIVNRCYAGFFKFASPIVLDGELIGAILGCQLIDPSIKDEVYKKTCERLNIDFEDFISLIKESHSISRAVLESEIGLITSLSRSSIELIRLFEKEGLKPHLEKAQELDLQKDKIELHVKDIEDLKSKTEELKAQTDEIIKDVKETEDLEAKVSVLKIQVETLRERAYDLEKEAERLKERAKELEEEAKKLREEAKETIGLRREVERLRNEARRVKKEVDLLKAQAEEAERVIIRAEEINELRSQRKELDILYSVTSKIMNMTQPREILRWLLDKMHSIFEKCHVNSFLILKRELLVGEIRNFCPISEECIEDIKKGLIENYRIFDRRKEGDRRPSFSISSDEFVSKAGTDYERVRSFTSAPLTDKEEIVGLLYMGSFEPNAFSSQDKRLFSLIANQTSQAVKRAKEVIDVSKKAEIDELTSVYNFRSFTKFFTKEFARAVRYNHHLSIAILDFDLLKGINDRYGHEEGNKVLRHTATLIKGEIRKPDWIARHGQDWVARFGGDEFVILFPETEEKNAVIAAERLRRLIANNKFSAGNESYNITVSLGIASFPKLDVRKARELFMRADEALYQAKQCGRNRVCVYQKPISGFKEGKQYT